MKKNIIIIASVIIVLAGAGIGVRSYMNRNKNIAYYWRTAPVEKGDLKVTVTATGTMAADTTIQVGTQVTGLLLKQYVDFNSVVRKGQLMALIDTTNLYPAMLDAKAAWEKAIAQRDEYKRELDRTKIELDNKVAAQQDYDLALTNFQTEDATVKSMEAEYMHALINLQYAYIRAPISGVVISRTYDIGIMVIASFSTPTLFTIANDLKKLQVQADVDEADIGQVKNGQEVDFTVDAYPDDVFHGVVNQIRLNPVMVQNVVNYVVIVEAPNPDLKLIPGLTANVNIRVQVHKGILRVPANATGFEPPVTYIDNATLIPDSTKRSIEARVQQLANKIIEEQAYATIWIKRGNDIFPVSVKKGLTDGIYTEVSGDIKEGDLVVTGLNSSAASAEASSPSSSGTQNPFVPKFPTSHKK
ncbi:MAG: efflux RND transporter periplasmic adaptor subunit [Bacteroidia bacterium]